MADFNIFDCFYLFLCLCVLKMIPSSTIYLQGSSSLLSDGPFIFQMREALGSSKPLIPYVFIHLFSVLPIDPVSIKMHDRLYFKLQQADLHTNFLQETFAGCVISSISSSVCLHLHLLLPHLPTAFFCITLSPWRYDAAGHDTKLPPSWLSFIMSILFVLIFLSISICSWHSFLPLFQFIPLSLPLRCSSPSCSGFFPPSVSLTRFVLCSNYNTKI